MTDSLTSNICQFMERDLSAINIYSDHYPRSTSHGDIERLTWTNRATQRKQEGFEGKSDWKPRGSQKICWNRADLMKRTRERLVPGVEIMSRVKLSSAQTVFRHSVTQDSESKGPVTYTLQNPIIIYIWKSDLFMRKYEKWNNQNCWTYAEIMATLIKVSNL